VVGDLGFAAGVLALEVGVLAFEVVDVTVCGVVGDAGCDGAARAVPATERDRTERTTPLTSRVMSLRSAVFFIDISPDRLAGSGWPAACGKTLA
jgi:hypothetical protein